MISYLKKDNMDSNKNTGYISCTTKQPGSTSKFSSL